LDWVIAVVMPTISPRALGKSRHILVVMDRIDRALLQAGAAVDARLRIDVRHFSAIEFAGGPDRADAIDRACRHAAGILATVLSDHVRHGWSSQIPPRATS
jgi:hypothetical protein